MIITGTRVRGGRYYGGTATAGDTYFNLVSLLLPGNGTNGAQNNTFLDSSSNVLTVTRNGNTTQGTFSPFSQTGWSVYFGGTNYLTSSYNIAFAPDSGDFTVECWVYFTASPTGTDQGFVGNINMSSGDGDWLLFWRGGVSRWEFSATSNGSVGTIQRSYNTTTPSAGQWYHVVGVKNGSTLSCYVNGVKGTDGTLATVNNGSSTLNIGQGASNTGRVTGNISNLRITKGGALYSGSTFTPPTAPLTTTVSTGTVSLLTCQSNRFIDNSTNAFALVTSGAAVQPFSPFNPDAAYSTTSVGGSGYFDGTGDYLTVADSATLEPGSSNFTIECWIYPTATGSFLGVFSKRTNNATDYSPIQILINSGTMILSASTTGSSWAVNVNASTSPPLNAWSHIAVVRNGTASNNLVLYLNGVSVATGSVSNTALVNNSGAWAIAADSDDGGGNFAGYISGFRYVLGSAVYTAAFTPPAAPFTAITNTAILLNYTNGGITDATAKNVLETVDGAAISTAQSKFGGSSMLFDGSGDYLVSPASVNYEVGTGSYTIEFWVYWNVIGNIAMLFGWNGGATGSTFGYTYSDGRIGVGINGTNEIVSSSGQATTGSWIHMAFVKNGSTTTIYKNGVAIASGTTGVWSSNTGTATFSVGGGASASDTNCYIDDLRITKGYARYTADFTPPTAAFPTQ